MNDDRERKDQLLTARQEKVLLVIGLLVYLAALVISLSQRDTMPM